MKQYKNKLRAINQGTRYDITGLMRNKVREIERGDIEVTDVAIVVRKIDGSIDLRHLGTSKRETLHFMLSTAKNRCELP